jgi:murein DD-endopeptidase MepM/ murein hydrolase activator NlpD
MKFLYILSVVFFTLIGCPKIWAQETPVSDDVELEDIDAESDVSDSLAAAMAHFDTSKVPSASTYKIWNNAFVNPYDTDMVKKPDTTLIDLSGYCHPKKNYLTSDFGFRRYRHHYGVDIKVNVGDTIYATFDGMIRVNKYVSSYGNYIVVRHYNGLETVYAHLSKSLVGLNQQVKSGDPIALGGNTGHSTGPHLHFEVRYLGVCINPHDIIDFNTYAIKSDKLNLNANNFAYLADIRKVRYHVVRRGETLGRIAMKHGTTVKRLCKLNKIRPGKVLRVGQRIRYT